MGVLVWALLSAGLQDAAARQEASGLIFTLPAGWTRREVESPKSVHLIPPGAGPADAALILYPVVPDVAGTAQEIHDKMFRAMVAAASDAGEAQTGTTGLFQWTRSAMTPPGSPPLKIALYTAKSGTTAGVLMFGATEAWFKKHLPDVERMVKDLRFAGAADPAPPTAIHGLLLPLPPGWTRKDNPQGAVELSPPPPRGPLEPRWDYVLIVLPSQPLRGTLWETHKAIFQEALAASRLKDSVPPIHRPDGPGPFIRTESAGRDAAGNVRCLSMYSARSEDAIECIVVQNQEDRETLRALFEGTALKRPRKAADRPKIVEAYRRGEQKLHINPSGGAPLPGSLQYERIWLRSDGVADFATSYRDGHAASPEVLKFDAGLRNGRIGSWKPRGETQVEIVRTEGVAPEVYTREQGRLRLGDQVWQPMPAVDGLRLDGRWSLADVSIAFTKDGRFTDAGVAAHMALGDAKPTRPPKRGAGTYELREWTLLLAYDDGSTWSSDFSTIGADPKDLSSILLRTSAFRKD